MNNSILCSCKKNYFGPKCEYLSNNFKTRESCLNNVCKNAGTCVVKNGQTECICKNFYTGKYCESSVYKQCGNGICNSLHVCVKIFFKLIFFVLKIKVFFISLNIGCLYYGQLLLFQRL